MVGVGSGCLTTEPEDMGQEPQGYPSGYPPEVNEFHA